MAHATSEGARHRVIRCFEPVFGWYPPVMRKGLVTQIVVAGAAATTLVLAPIAGANPPAPCVDANGVACADVGPGSAQATVPGAGASAGPDGAQVTVPGAGAIAGPGGAEATVPGAGATAGPDGAQALVPGANANTAPGSAEVCIANVGCAFAG